MCEGWACHVRGEGRRFDTATAAVRALYAEQPEVDDQYLPAFVLGDYRGMVDGDAAVFTNFRGDRAIELSRAFDEGADFDTAAFDRGPRPTVHFAGMMEYDGDLHVPRRYLVAPPAIEGTVAEALSAAGVGSVAISETQKFGHVTYFFNGNRSDTPRGERRSEVPSRPGSADAAPQMRAHEVTAEIIAAMQEGEATALRINLANGDMVGHTGKAEAAREAVEVLDGCLAELWAACRDNGVVLMITADHGNVEQMLQLDKKTGKPKLVDGAPVPSTSHSLNPVPFVLADPTGRWRLAAEPGPTVQGSIARIGATVLTLAGVPVPEAYHPSLVRPTEPALPPETA
jgi:2,3-bisphosphoglycerate-independent phosphoglycerate mutase